MSRDSLRHRVHDMEVPYRQQLRLALGQPPPSPRLGTSDNAGCGRSCRRSPYARTPRSRSVRRGRRAPPCDSARSRSSPSAGRGCTARGWLHPERDRGRGRCPRPPELVGPRPRRYAPPAPPYLCSLACGAARSGVERALDLGDPSCRYAGVARRRLQLGVPEQSLDQPMVVPLSSRCVAKLWRSECRMTRLPQPRGSRRFLEQSAELARRSDADDRRDRERAAASSRGAAASSVGRAFHHCRSSARPAAGNITCRSLPTLRCTMIICALFDVARSQPHHLARPQPAAIAERQHRSCTSGSSPWSAAAWPPPARHRRQLLRLLEVPDLGRQIVPPQRDAGTETSPPS